MDIMRSENTTTTAAERAPVVAYLRTRATITVDALEEHEDPADSFAGDDAELDAQTVAKIREDYENGNPWAWTCIRVRAEFLGHSGEDYLGACSYESRADFQRTSGYYDDMLQSALDQVAHALILDRGTLAELADEIIRGCMSDAGLPTDLLENIGEFQRGGVVVAPTTVTIDADDKVELYHMLRGRGGSGLKTKLLAALAVLDPKYAAELRKLEE